MLYFHGCRRYILVQPVLPSFIGRMSWNVFGASESWPSSVGRTQPYSSVPTNSTTSSEMGSDSDVDLVCSAHMIILNTTM